jgi:hypothetical protein
MNRQPVTKIQDMRPAIALAALNRLTGLQWNGLPTSLLAEVHRTEAAQDSQERKFRPHFA